MPPKFMLNILQVTVKYIMYRSEQPAKLAMPMLILLPLLLLCYGVGNVRCSTVHDSSIDLQALLDFRQGITGDPNGALSNWTMRSHFCHWNGVECTLEQPRRVVGLQLTSQSLSGKISSSLGNLTFLNYLVLSYNNFIGPLPLLGRLQQLQILYLNNNNLSGIIPDEIANCSNLTAIDLSFNLLVGSIPPKLGLLSKLGYLSLMSNQLNGSIPGELGQLKLKTLRFGDNRLSGEIPQAFFRLSSLQYLSLELNMLGKALPPNIGELLPNLIELTLENNKFEGPIPGSLGNNAMGLEMIDLSSNNFTGRIPPSLGKLSNLTVLNLHDNQLVASNNQDWEFLNALRNCRSLKLLFLSNNELQGSLPKSIGNLPTSLQQLLLGGNSLSGQVPQSIGKLSALIKLGLDKNNFSGTIEGWVENLKRLGELNLQSNYFTGPIPSSISNLTQLTNLYLHKNRFEGPIPAALGNLPPLQKLDLSNNNLEGNIPPNFGNIQGLIMLNLSHNKLQDDIPYISNLKDISKLDLSWNKLTGQIPDSLGKCQALEIMKMDQNFLTGSIPSTFGNLKILSILNLSHNNLSGTIPQALNSLTSLRMLDLSYNNLNGQVPRNGVFENATAVSLKGNPGLCGGVMDLHMPSCTNISKKTETGYYLIRVLIPIFGFMSLILLVYFLFLVKKMPRQQISLNSSGENFLKVSYNDLAQATSNFSESNLIGRGSYGSVYRGKLKESKMEVAVKVFDLEMGGAEKSFLKECEVLRSIQHRNLLPIVTACSTVDNTRTVFKALVYEFMANGNLDRWLHNKGDGIAKKQLSLTQRLSIAVNIADALDYIHHDCGRPTIHCDLKPSNILLDDDMNALLGDFGIASFYQDSSSSKSAGPIISSVGVKGTIGYIAPEYAGGSRHAATSDDVYGFGIILLEMMTGKRPTDPMFKDGVSIVNFVDSNFPHEIFHVIDAHLTEECNNFSEAKKASENAVHQCLVSVLQIALSCTNQIASKRMNMKEIASRLHAIQTSYMSKGKNSMVP